MHGTCPASLAPVAVDGKGTPERSDATRSCGRKGVRLLVPPS